MVLDSAILPIETHVAARISGFCSHLCLLAMFPHLVTQHSHGKRLAFAIYEFSFVVVCVDYFLISLEPVWLHSSIPFLFRSDSICESCVGSDDPSSVIPPAPDGPFQCLMWLNS